MTTPAGPAEGTARSNSGAGSLDRTFGRSGKVVVPIALQPIAAAVQPDGRIVIAGNVGSGLGHIAVVRLLPSGALDTSFASGGILSLNADDVSSLRLLSGGKILLGGIASSGNEAELIQVLGSGKLDSSFGNGGIVQFDYVANSSNAVLVALPQADGKIVAAGFGLATGSDDYLTSLARFDSAGHADTSFGSNGIVAVAVAGGVTAVGLQSDGKILVCGGFITRGPSLVVRFLKDGTLDKNDAGGSLVAIAHTGSATFEGANEFQLDGKLLQWSDTQNEKGNRHYVQVTRLLRDETPDPNFKSPRFAFASPTFDRANDVEIAADGKLLVGGQGLSRGNTVFGLARLQTGGALDGSFGSNGRVVTDFSGIPNLTAIAIQPDGKIIGAGILSSGGSHASLAVARYWGG